MMNPKEPNVSEHSLRSPQSALLTPQSRYVLPSFVERTSYGIGRSHDEAVAVRQKQRQKAQEQAGGEMAIEGTEAEDRKSVV